MNSRTQELTFGAMLIAVFGVILVLNRQTGGLFEELIFFILPIPMTIFSMKYDWKDSLSVFVCMAVLSFFLGTLYTAFYAVTEAFLGIILGLCLRTHKDLNRTQLLVMGLSAVFSVVGSVVLASVLGMDLDTELAEMQTMMNSVFAGAKVIAKITARKPVSAIRCNSAMQTDLFRYGGGILVEVCSYTSK